MELPADFLAEVAAHERANATFQGLNRANQYAIYHRLATASPTGRAKVMASLLAMLARGERFHA